MLTNPDSSDSKLENTNINPVNISNVVPEVDVCNSSTNKGKGTKTPKKKSVRCHVCRKKIGMLVFRCKCSSELTFCSSHVQPESHNCTFDHKSDAIGRLEATLPKITHDKIIRI